MAKNSAKPASRQGKFRRLRGLAQATSLGLFLLLLWGIATPPQGADGAISPNFFLRLDPLAAAINLLAGREWLATLFPALLLLILALLAGRLFCGWLCPMGATLDAASSLINRYADPQRKPARTLKKLRKTKYLLLIGGLAAAMAGVNLAGWIAPIPLITRFYGLLLHPLALLGGHEALNFGRPFLESLDWPAASYLSIAPRRFASMYFLVVFFGLLFWLERLRPRFWCNFLCPAGALLGLFSLLPLWRRRVSACTGCGKCAQSCLAGAISSQGQYCLHGECITCQTCANVCTTGSALFSLFRKEKISVQAKSALEAKTPSRSAPVRLSNKPGQSVLPSRRAFLAAAIGGIGLAGLGHSSLTSLLGPDLRGIIYAENCLRPPGALPEAVFLKRCLRCGLCMRACPTNGLQPAWLAAGPEGAFSPVLVPRRGPCEPDCNLCGWICPTQAISPLELAEKRWAKIGGAVVHNNRCLAWAEGKRCVVCQEVCPYGAVEYMQTADTPVPVPMVKAARCFGCGYCELHCPVRISAITVQPLNALRLAEGSYIQAGKAAGLELAPAQKNAHEPPSTMSESGLPPGFAE